MTAVPTSPPTALPPSPSPAEVQSEKRKGTTTPSPTISSAGVRTEAPTPPPTDAVSVREDSITLRVYPYESFQRDEIDRTYNIAYKQFDISAYSAASRVPIARIFKTVNVENEYLRLTLLPELGGRLYQVIYKPTGQTIFYNNAVLKPTPWGPEQQGGWLAIGGLEWALPVDEHGYEWGTPWKYSVNGSTVTLWDSDASDRVRARISITLPPHAAYFVVHPHVENGTRATVPIQFWINAMLALNGKQIAGDTEFILSTPQIFVHSTGNDWIPNDNIPAATAKTPANPLPWHIVAGRDLAYYKNWENYLGVFATAQSANFTGAYDHTNELGIARVFPHERVPGVKLFAWGPKFDGRDLFTDDGGEYFELWGGLPRTFWSYQQAPFAPGEVREWDEYWIPFARTGGLSGASRQAVLYLDVDATHHAAIGAAATTRGTRGTLVLSRWEPYTRDGIEAKRWKIALDPGQIFRQSVELPGEGRWQLRLIAEDGTLIAETQ